MGFEYSLLINLLKRKKIVFLSCAVSLLFGFLFYVFSPKIWVVEAVLGKPAQTVVSQYSPFSLNLLQVRAEELMRLSKLGVPFNLRKEEPDAAGLLAIFGDEVKSPMRFIDFLRTRSDYTSDLLQDDGSSSFDEKLPLKAYNYLSNSFELVWDSKQKNFLTIRYTFTGNFQGDRFLNSYIEYLNSVIWAERKAEVLESSSRIQNIVREVTIQLLNREKERILDQISTYREGINLADSLGLDRPSCTEIQCLQILGSENPSSAELAQLGTDVLSTKIERYEKDLPILATESDQKNKEVAVLIRNLVLDLNDKNSPAKVIVPAFRPAKPISPNALKILAVFGAIGFLIGIGIVVLAELPKNLKKILAEGARI